MLEGGFATSLLYALEPTMLISFALERSYSYTEVEAVDEIIFLTTRLGVLMAISLGDMMVPGFFFFVSFLLDSSSAYP